MISEGADDDAETCGGHNSNRMVCSEDLGVIATMYGVGGNSPPLIAGNGPIGVGIP